MEMLVTLSVLFALLATIITTVYIVNKFTKAFNMRFEALQKYIFVIGEYAQSVNELVLELKKSK